MNLRKVNRCKRYMLANSFKKNSFDRWRLVMNGFNTVTGADCTFFIEFYVLNPLLSHSECILGFKSRLEKAPEDLQYALAGTETGKTLLTEKDVRPSFVMIKVGRISKNGKQLNAYFPSDALKTNSDEYILKVGTSESNACVLTDFSTSGSVTVSKTDLIQQPELLCDSGSFAWNLRYTIEGSLMPNYASSGINWSCFGARTSFSGMILMDGEKYAVNTTTSYGYFDKNWGKDFSNPFFHLSSNNLTSNISGKKLLYSCFAIQGVYNKRLSLLSMLEDKKIEFHAGGRKKYSIVYDFSETVPDDDGVKLHWTVSINDRKHVVDVDVFCKAESMIVREYECPEGGRKMLKVLSGATGTGELKLYRKVKKNLELIEDVHIANCLCEYGNIEYPVK